MHKTIGSENAADRLTKHPGRNLHEKHVMPIVFAQCSSTIFLMATVRQSLLAAYQVALSRKPRTLILINSLVVEDMVGAAVGGVR